MTSDPVCLDANYLVALFDQRDRWHPEAARIHTVLREHGASTITPDCVMNEVLTVFARRCRERGSPEVFVKLADALLQAVPVEVITWLYPHVAQWFAGCVAVMRETAATLNFHDALLCVAADELGYQAIVSFDEGFDQLAGIRRLGSADMAKRWLADRAPGPDA